MSLEKLAHDSYTQGFTETLRSLNVPDSVKVASYKQAATAGIIAGALGQHEARKRMEAAGLTDEEIREVSTIGGGALRGFGREALYSLGGNVVGLPLGPPGMALGGLIGSGYGAYRQYNREQDAAQEAIEGKKKRKPKPKPKAKAKAKSDSEKEAGIALGLL